MKQPMEEVCLETERLRLRNVRATDAAGFFELDSNPNVHRFLGNNPITNLEQAERTIEKIQQQYATEGIGRWAIIDKQTNNFVGWTGLKFTRETINSHTNFYDLGYRLIERYWGKGIATETAHTSLHYAFTTLNLTEVYGRCAVENTGSGRVLEKAGLTFINTFMHEGIKHNWYKITEDEWAAVHSKLP